MSLPASDLTKKPDMRTTMELGAVLPETAEVRDDHLFIGGVDMVELAREEGTALYVLDEADLRHAHGGLPRGLPQPLRELRRRLRVSKAFLNKEVPRASPRPRGCAWTCLAAASWPAPASVDFPTERVFVHGNNKTPRELRRGHLRPAWGASCFDSAASSWPA